MKFAFYRDYRFGTQEDANSFFEKAKFLSTNEIGIPIKYENFCTVVFLENEKHHIEIDSFAWTNKELWQSYLGSFETELTNLPA